MENNLDLSHLDSMQTSLLGSEKRSHNQQTYQEVPQTEQEQLKKPVQEKLKNIWHSIKNIKLLPPELQTKPLQEMLQIINPEINTKEWVLLQEVWGQSKILYFGPKPTLGHIRSNNSMIVLPDGKVAIGGFTSAYKGKQFEELKSKGPVKIHNENGKIGVSSIIHNGRYIYIGDVNQNGKEDGYGVETWSDGTRYEGYFKDDERHGYGVLTWSDGTRHEGHFKNGEIHGYGVYTSEDETRYEGNWKDGKIHGYGFETWSDGTRYEGYFKDDKRHGKGVLTWSDGTKHEGHFENGKFDGKIFRKSGNEYEYEASYKGQFQNSKKHGKGIETYPDGSKYIGQFQNGKKHGKGVLKLPNGTRYEGEWRDDNKNGKGIMILPDGEKYKQHWDNGKLISQEQLNNVQQGLNIQNLQNNTQQANISSTSENQQHVTNPNEKLESKQSEMNL